MDKDVEFNSQEAWLKSYREKLVQENNEQLNSNREIISKFKDYCESKGCNLDDSNFEYIPTIGIVAKSPNILSYLADELNKDKEGLVDCRDLYRLFTKKIINAGYLYSDNFMLMLSPLFRRNLYEDNNWSPNFVELFWQVSGKKQNIESYISLDYDRVRINVSRSGLKSSGI